MPWGEPGPGGSREIFDMTRRFLAAYRSTGWARRAGPMARAMAQVASSSDGSSRWKQPVEDSAELALLALAAIEFAVNVTILRRNSRALLQDAAQSGHPSSKVPSNDFRGVDQVGWAGALWTQLAVGTG